MGFPENLESLFFKITQKSFFFAEISLSKVGMLIRASDFQQSTTQLRPKEGRYFNAKQLSRTLVEIACPDQRTNFEIDISAKTKYFCMNVLQKLL